MSVEILPPRILFDGVTGIAHYETMRSTRVGSFEDRAEEIIRELLDANYSAWCDATGTMGGLPDLWIWESDPFLRQTPIHSEAALRMHTALQTIVANCSPAYDWKTRPVHESAEAALPWLATLIDN
ncbi:hypothetical protein [Brevibacterium renqingii]|uniref:hypothetical protein n=1 Tax=Brevibacterium renqingii TaxID=2776916 RepID=UPI001ADED4A0|nr:hypothetical protein [Brevibacterium renqingii]